MTYNVPFEMTYSFSDRVFRPEEYVFAELYIVGGGTGVVYYKRIPETGYFSQDAGPKSFNPLTVFGATDDSSSGKVTGSVSLGASSYDPDLPKQTLEAFAVLYKANGTSEADHRAPTVRR